MDSKQVNGFTHVEKMYLDSIFLNVFVFSGPKIKCIPESGEVIVSQTQRGCVPIRAGALIGMNIVCSVIRNLPYNIPCKQQDTDNTE